MRVADLFSIQIPEALQDIEVKNLSSDSRSIQPGDLYLAVHNESQYIYNAIDKGAILVVKDGGFALQYENNIPVLSYPNLRQELGQIAARFHLHPSKKLRIFGVTGTSGKTSVTTIIVQLLHQLSIPCGVVGTLGSGIFGRLSETGFTTPDAVSLQKILADFVHEKIIPVAMEVSSHGVDQGRINGIEFETNVFTNLSQDHLDYHVTLENYAQVKKYFIEHYPSKYKVINFDDLYGKKWLAELHQKELAVYGYSLLENSTAFPLTFCRNIHTSLSGTSADIVSPWGEGRISLPLVGEFNLSNALAAINVLCLYGINLQKILTALPTIQPVPGRMQFIRHDNAPIVVVDYAHKPDALEKILRTIRLLTHGKLHCVFGCGGERDTLKRPIMGSIAETYCDRIVLTNDNPRHESPDTIVSHIVTGFTNMDKVRIELDRFKAINSTINEADPEDCIVIAGKGAETYQIIGNEKFPFDDAQEVKKCLESRKNKQSVGG